MAVLTRPDQAKTREQDPSKQEPRRNSSQETRTEKIHDPSRLGPRKYTTQKTRPKNLDPKKYTAQETRPEKILDSRNAGARIANDTAVRYPDWIPDVRFAHNFD